MTLRKTEIKFPHDLLALIDQAAVDAGTNRSQFVRDTLEQHLAPNNAYKRFPTAVTEILKLTDGKLSRLQAEHIASIVIKTIHNA